MPTDLDHRVRLRAFAFLAEQLQLHGEVLPRQVLHDGFEFEGSRVPLIGPQGIFKPALLPEMPLSITTVPIAERKERPYADEIGDDGLLRYRYRGTDPRHRDNVGLRLAMQRRAPDPWLDHGRPPISAAPLDLVPVEVAPERRVVAFAAAASAALPGIAASWAAAVQAPATLASAAAGCFMNAK